MSGAAKYEQGRLNRVTDHSPRNTVVDATAFRPIAEAKSRDEAVITKKILEGDIAVLKARIARAKAMVWEGKGYTPPKTFGRWQVELAEKVREVTRIDGLLRQLNAAEAPAVAAKRQDILITFDEAFAAAAKEMLADAVYDRVRIAALHRMAERGST